MFKCCLGQQLKISFHTNSPKNVVVFLLLLKSTHPCLLSSLWFVSITLFYILICSVSSRAQGTPGYGDFQRSRLQLLSSQYSFYSRSYLLLKYSSIPRVELREKVFCLKCQVSGLSSLETNKCWTQIAPLIDGLTLKWKEKLNNL